MDPNIVLQWLVEAAEELQAFVRDCLCDVHVRQMQLDELYAILHPHPRPGATASAQGRQARSPRLRRRRGERSECLTAPLPPSRGKKRLTGTGPENCMALRSLIGCGQL